jgi:hypothetical protein
MPVSPLANDLAGHVFDGGLQNLIHFRPQRAEDLVRQVVVQDVRPLSGLPGRVDAGCAVAVGRVKRRQAGLERASFARRRAALADEATRPSQPAPLTMLHCERYRLWR